MSEGPLNIYLVSTTEDVDYDEYDSFVVAAASKAEALLVAREVIVPEEDRKYYDRYLHKFAIGTAEIEFLGQLDSKQKQEPGVILGSYNAG